MWIDDSELERILVSQPRWTPPTGFTTRTVARASIVSQEWPALERGRSGEPLRVALRGLAVAFLAYAATVLLLWIAPPALSGIDAVIDGYWRLLELTPKLLVARAVPVAWVSAALSLSLATSLVLRTRG